MEASYIMPLNARKIMLEQAKHLFPASEFSKKALNAARELEESLWKDIPKFSFNKDE